MDLIQNTYHTVAEVIDIIGISILLYGFIKMFLKYIHSEFIKNPFRGDLRDLQLIRCDIAIYILLALDFLIASDIIVTIGELITNQLLQLSVMIILRTGIGFFLGKELEDLKAVK